MWVPETMRDGAGFVIVYVLQLAFTLIQQSALLTFTLLVIILTESATANLCLLRREILCVCGLEVEESASLTAVKSRSDSERRASVEGASLDGNIKSVTEQLMSISRAKKAWMANAVSVIEEGMANSSHEDIEPRQDVASPTAEAVSDFLTHPAPFTAADPAVRLQRLSERYRRVFLLVSETVSVFGAPLLGLHAAVAAILLLAGYVGAGHLSGRRGLSVDVAGLSLVMVYWFVCLLTVNVSGSGLLERSQELHSALAKQCWPAARGAAQRRRLGALLEQTRGPLTLHVCGVFTVRKEALLSVLSFVLTYFVIMMQMIR
ncbi:hypothetical protein FJT64_023624 [Amphibalanus amphitrite]|uniref:Uncharacterized protein n=1 Tax=Amphibalanus amphitrite TaxID=1232801 RepID=A0A6A4WH80_AMPAM|nr:hypothetical protein FJT64_023624 [Amphibalanus amphitrite]